MSGPVHHGHRPWRPMCNERRLSDGQLRGACLNDDGTPRSRPDECEDAIRRLIADIDPAVQTWIETIREVQTRNPHPAAEAWDDGRLEAIAEARADDLSYDDDNYFADREADRYERFILGEN